MAAGPRMRGHRWRGDPSTPACDLSFDRAGSCAIIRSMSTINLKVNGRAHTVDADPSTPLLYILRNDLDLQGPRFGCGLGQCGACTVIINGTAVRSCITPVSSVKAEITTLEGLSQN